MQIDERRCPKFTYPADQPLVFNVCVDPSEGIPLAGALPSGKVALNNPGAECYVFIWVLKSCNERQSGVFFFDRLLTDWRNLVLFLCLALFLFGGA